MKNPNPDRYIHSYDQNEGCAVIKSGTRIVARVYDPDPTQALVIAAVFSASPRRHRLVLLGHGRALHHMP